MELNQFSTVDIVLDKANDNFIQKQTISAGDRNGRSLTLQVTDAGSIGEVPGLTANLLWTNHSSGVSDLSAFSVVDRTTSVFKINYPQNMLTAGKVTAQIQLLHNGKVTHSKKFEIIVLDVAGNLKGVLQTAEYTALVEALAKTNGFEGNIRSLEMKKAEKSIVETLQVIKADKTYVDTMLSSIASGGPKELFYSLNALQVKYPSGAEGTYLVFDTSHTDGAHSYMWKDGAWNDLGVYQGMEVADNSLDRKKLTFPTELGLIAYGEIRVDYSIRKLTVKKSTILSTHNNASVYTTTDDIVLDTPSPSAGIQYLCFDRVDSSYKFKASNNVNDTILLGMVYQDKFYKATENSKISEYPVNLETYTNPKISNLSFINYSAGKYIRINTSQKTVVIEEGHTPFDNVTGRYYRNNSEITLTYTEPSAQFAPTLYFDYMSKTYYVDVTPQKNTDVKLFSWIYGKVYGADESTKKIIIIDNVKNGGWGNESAAIDNKFKYQSLDEWFSVVASGVSSKIMWLGDSTWQGYTGPVNGGTTPFPIRIQSKLNDFFGLDKVKSINKSIGGESIIGMVGRLEGYLQEHPDTDVLMIGCGLNGVNASSTSSRRNAFEQAIALCKQYDVMPVICTAQAHQVPNVETGDDWGGRSQFAIEKYDRALRLGIAKKYNLDVIDYTDFTQKLLDYASESISQLVEDGLHGSAIMHAYESDWTVSQLIPTVKKIKGTEIVTIYDQKVSASRSLRYVEDIVRDTYGFKSQWNFDANANDILMDVWLYLDPEKSTWSIKPQGTGFKTIVNGAETNSLDNLKPGLYHTQILATGGQVTFKGIVCEA